jgi:4-hydroxy-2-oxoheptanedioate aldolase
MTGYDLRGELALDPLFATFVMTASPVAVEALAATPFAALCLDMEHSTLSAGEVEALVRAADAHGRPMIVRVPTIGPDIPRVLDAGAAGIIVPQVETAEQARSVVDRARYAPIGRRGLGAARGALYGAALSEHWVDDVNARTLVTVQIETAAGVEAADEILATPGIDAVVIGPGDLSLSLGVPMGSSDYWAAVDRVFAAARAHGVAPGSFCFRDPDLPELLHRGVRLVFLAGDLTWMLEGASRQWDRLQEAVAAEAREGVR